MAIQTLALCLTIICSSTYKSTLFPMLVLPTIRRLPVVHPSLTKDSLRISDASIPALPTGLCYINWNSGRSDETSKRLESVQNTAARLVSGARRHDHAAAVLHRLHWLPMCLPCAYLVWPCLEVNPHDKA